ncbi:ATPase family AAA domain-containing protein 2-like isoform X2 [Mytilus galloprovincialis]|uniref:ATPase family AAA domain-containing protein 2-like isoform X2 n=1 Tax=Mytilus galloprovincialis TaxID=29158 RepID=UPI003F7C3307
MVKTRNSIGVTEESPDTFLSLSRDRANKPQRSVNYESHSDESDEVQIADLDHRQKAQSPTLRRSRHRRYKEEDESNDDEIDAVSYGRARRRSWKYSRNNNAADGDVRRSSRQRKMIYGTFDQKILEKALYMNGDDMQPGRKRKRNEVELVDVEKSEDMYSRVKRPRKVIKRDMYGIPIPDDTSDENKDDEDDDDDDSSSDDDDEEDDDDDDNDEEEEEKKERSSYNLREHKPRTQLFEVPVVERRKRVQKLFRETPPLPPKRRQKSHVYQSPAHRKLEIRRKAQFHGSDTTSSSSCSESDDEERFKRRKAKSMARARNRCLPMNISAENLKNSNIIKDRVKIGSSLADVDPMNVDRTVNFNSVGGLGKHVRALKEMIVFPLLYPEVFERFKLAPPRGVLFYGPPGTGKTLVARALANECSTGNRRVGFFMRKGADCLSKWVGESERQLRLLFDQAYQMRPSIIFFDEIDGLAPVRSSRQDQIHSSIVSTLLALMDGLDSRGEIVVIGATNRIDSIDPALRRPGRFDREFLFPLPSQEARRQILHIHTKEWNPKLSAPFVSELAEKTVGYCGADLKSLCTEASLLALRRRYPQIYTTSEKLQLDVSSINLAAKDFFNAMNTIVPASQRSVTSPARALSMRVQPLLRNIFKQCIDAVQKVFPSVFSQLSCLDAPATTSQQESSTNLLDQLDSDEDENAPSIYENKGKGKKKKEDNKPETFLSFASYASKTPTTHRPRMLLAGQPGQGQTTHLAPGILHNMEQLPVHVLDLPSLFAVSTKTPEESCAQVFREARRTAPSIIYMPDIEQLWSVLTETLRATFMMMLNELDPTAPILLLATSECHYSMLGEQLTHIFDSNFSQVIKMAYPSEAERREFFTDILLNQAVQPPSQRKQAAKRFLEILPKAAPPEPRKYSARELEKIYEQEETTLRELRLFLRDVLNKLGRDRKFHLFAKPVDTEDAPDYYEIIKHPMDLGTMMSKIDLHRYQTAKSFLDDISRICLNALEYNPDKTPAGRAIRHRACALKDTAEAILKVELDPEFEAQCQELVNSRKNRGIDPQQSAPNFYHTKPLQSTSTSYKPFTSNPDNRSRTSRRLRGLDIENTSPLEQVEKQWAVEKSIRKGSPEKTPEKRDNSASDGEAVIKQLTSSKKKPHSCRKAISGDDCSRSVKKPLAKKDIWSSSGYRSRRKKRNPLSASPSKDSQFSDSGVKDSRFSDTDDYDVSEVIANCNSSPASKTSGKSPEQEEKSSGRRNSVSSTGRRSSISSRSRDRSKDRFESPHRQSSSKSPTRNTSGKSSDRRRSKSPDRQSTSKETSGHPTLKKHTPSSQKGGEKNLELSVVVENISPNKSGKMSPRVGTTKPMETDSGISSSVDSNGDSVDSVEHAKLLASQKLNTSQEGATSKQDSEDEKVTSPKFRATRSRLQTEDHEHALQILEEEAMPVIVDQERLNKLLDNTVALTKNYRIEKLEKLYSLYSNCIYCYRQDHDKTSMIEEMENILQRQLV